MEKRRFLVVINQKYLIIVESTSLGGAEHVVLDQFHYFVQGAQAFELTETTFLFEMFPDVETTIFQSIRKTDQLLYADYLKKKANQMLVEADSIIDTYSK